MARFVLAARGHAGRGTAKYMPYRCHKNSSKSPDPTPAPAEGGKARPP